MEKLLILNPGSTSTKIAVYDGETPLFVDSIVHETEQISKFEKVAEMVSYAFAMLDHYRKSV
ncbi:hypothetical protein AGMMS50276_07310 [Synergistales bacterium]|nr:hypothetical protein AGMMS50276_07310 [Synergistales bacterium]